MFRADAAFVFGSGHIMRCLTLASALREHGVAVFFICREHDGHLCDLIEDRGFTVSRLPAPKGGLFQTEGPPAHAAWLGASWQEDAEQTRVAIEASGVKPDWLVVDHYAIDQRWEYTLRTSAWRIMSIDDLADRVHACDLLLDQNLVAQMHTRYGDKVPAACGLLLGSEYALLQTSYAKLYDRVPPREGPIRRMFIFFGGADTHNLTGRVLNAFLSLNRSDIQVDVVIASSGLCAESVRHQAEGHDNIHLHSGLPTLAPLLAQADLAIGAGGSTSWERLCLGLPALVVTLADNQRAVANELSQRGLIRWLGHHDEVDELTIAQALNRLIQQELEEDWSLRCRATVDGNGANRVCAALTVKANTPLWVRYARLDDEALLLTWANEPATRSNAFSPALILAAGHRAWFRARLRNLDGCRLYIVETTEGIALGQVRFERQGHAWEISYALAQMFRGRSIGLHLLEAALLKFRADTPGVLIFGQVKTSNYRSMQIFESLGFERQPSTKKNVVVYQRVGGQ